MVKIVLNARSVSFRLLQYVHITIEDYTIITITTYKVDTSSYGQFSLPACCMQEKSNPPPRASICPIEHTINSHEPAFFLSLKETGVPGEKPPGQSEHFTACRCQLPP